MWKLYEIYISVSINKYNGKAAMFVHWCIVCGHFCVTRAELNCNRDHMVCKAYDIYKLARPGNHPCARQEEWGRGERTGQVSKVQ